MLKTLKRHGNSWALVLDKPILDLLNIQPDSPLEVSTNGHSLLVTPVGAPTTERMAAFLKAKGKAERKLAPVLKKLAK
jgi:antitoxin MazE